MKKFALLLCFILAVISADQDGMTKDRQPLPSPEDAQKVELKYFDLYYGPSMNTTNNNNTEIITFLNAAGDQLQQMGFTTDKKVSIYVSGTGLKQMEDGCYNSVDYITCTLDKELISTAIAKFVLPGDSVKGQEWVRESIMTYMKHRIMAEKEEKYIAEEWESIETTKQSWMFWQFLDSLDPQFVSKLWKLQSQGSGNILLKAAELSKKDIQTLYAEFVGSLVSKQPWNSFSKLQKSGDTMKPDKKVGWFGFNVIDMSSFGTCKDAKFKVSPTPENWRFVKISTGSSGVEKDVIVDGNKAKEISFCPTGDKKSFVAVVPTSMDMQGTPSYEMSLDSSTDAKNSTDKPEADPGLATTVSNNTEGDPKPVPQSEPTNFVAITYFSVGLALVGIDIIRDLFK